MPAITTSCRRKRGEEQTETREDQQRSMAGRQPTEVEGYGAYLVEGAGGAVVVAREEHAAERVAEGLDEAQVPGHEGARRRRLHQMQLVQCAARAEAEPTTTARKKPSLAGAPAHDQCEQQNRGSRPCLPLNTHGGPCR
jgi:hypothetical protein